MTTSINFDIKIDGDDADDFMQAYSEKFNVDLSAFDFYRYFNEEGFRLIDVKALWLCFLGKKKHQPLYVSDMYEAIINGKWAD